MEVKDLGARIKTLRDGIESIELAKDAGIDPSVLSLIEDGKRPAKVGEIAKIAESLGISPLAILEPDSLLARLPVAARSTTDALDKEMNVRLVALAELHHLLFCASIKPTISISDLPDIEELEWLDQSKKFANWAKDNLKYSNGDDRFSNLVVSIENNLGIDIVVEPYDDALGSAITDKEFPLILINSQQSVNDLDLLS